MQDFREYLSNLQHQIAAVDDQLAYKRLFELFSKGMLAFAFTLVRSREVAEEIVSDVFIKIWLHRKNLPGIRNLRLYLYTSTRNLSLNYLRRGNPEFALDLSGIEADAAFSWDNPEELFITRELRRRISGTVEQLPPKCRLIFRLVKEDGLSYREVSELLQISSKTIESQIGIALKRISRSIRPNLDRLPSR